MRFIISKKEAQERFGSDSIYLNYSNRKLMEAITAKLMRLPVPGKLLDVGTGYGEYLSIGEELRFESWGIDIDQQRLVKAKRYSHRLKKADITEHIPFPDEFFDVVLCSEVLEHVTVPSRVVAEISRVLRPHGDLILSVPGHGWWRWIWPRFFNRHLFLDEHEHLREYSFFRLKYHQPMASLAEILNETHLYVSDLSGVFIFDLPFMYKLLSISKSEKFFSFFDTRLAKLHFIRPFCRYFVFVCQKH